VGKKRSVEGKISAEKKVVGLSRSAEAYPASKSLLKAELTESPLSGG